jgi:hypothetical protein
MAAGPDRTHIYLLLAWPGIKPLRVLLNQSALDVLYYHDPRCCQRIIDEMCKNMSAMYALFLERHPGFEDNGGKVLYTCAMKCYHFLH